MCKYYSLSLIDSLALSLLNYFPRFIVSFNVNQPSEICYIYKNYYVIEKNRVRTSKQFLFEYKTDKIE